MGRASVVRAAFDDEGPASEGSATADRFRVAAADSSAFAGEAASLMTGAVVVFDASVSLGYPGIPPTHFCLAIKHLLHFSDPDFVPLALNAGPKHVEFSAQVLHYEPFSTTTHDDSKKKKLTFFFQTKCFVASQGRYKACIFDVPSFFFPL